MTISHQASHQENHNKGGKTPHIFRKKRGEMTKENDNNKKIERMLGAFLIALATSSHKPKKKHNNNSKQTAGEDHKSNFLIYEIAESLNSQRAFLLLPSPLLVQLDYFQKTLPPSCFVYDTISVESSSSTQLNALWELISKHCWAALVVKMKNYSSPFFSHNSHSAEWYAVVSCNLIKFEFNEHKFTAYPKVQMKVGFVYGWDGKGEMQSIIIKYMQKRSSHDPEKSISRKRSPRLSEGGKFFIFLPHTTREKEKRESRV